MSGWVKTSVDWFEDPQIEDLGADATVLHLSGLAYTARHLMNGRLPTRALRRLYPVPDLDTAVQTLVDAERWQPVEDGFLIVDWADHILSADEVERMREQSRITSERYRRHKNDDHSMCDRCSAVRKQRDAVTDRVTDRVSDPPPIRSVPLRPEGEERGGEEETGGSTTSHGSAPLRRDSSAPPPSGKRDPTTPGIPRLPGPPPGVIPIVNGVPVWGPGSDQEVKR